MNKNWSYRCFWIPVCVINFLYDEFHQYSSTESFYIGLGISVGMLIAFIFTDLIWDLK